MIDSIKDFFGIGCDDEPDDLTAMLSDMDPSDIIDMISELESEGESELADQITDWLFQNSEDVDD